MRGWVVIAVVAATLAAVIGGLSALIAEAKPVAPLDAQVLQDARRNGATIDLSMTGTAECWLPLPGSVEVGPFRRCRAIVSATTALQVLDYSGAHAQEMGLADASWAPPCRGSTCGSVMRRRLAWVVKTDRPPSLGGYHGVATSCGSPGTLVFIDAHTDVTILVLMWGRQPGVPPPAFGCG